MRRNEGDEDGQTDDFDLSTFYTVLSDSLRRTTEVRTFRLISELMVYMLRTKVSVARYPTKPL